jgi:hypothetical protein
MFVFSVPGFVPLEYAEYYPFAYYDWDRRRERREDFEVLVRQLYRYAVRFFRERQPQCATYVAYFRPSAPHVLVMQRAAEAVGVTFVQAPRDALVDKIIRRSGRASWRFRGLKRPDCLRALERTLRARTKGEE